MLQSLPSQPVFADADTVMSGPAAVESGIAGLVGRARELALLRDRLARTAAGQGGLVALGGEAGIGKTRVAQTAAAVARAMGVTVLWGRCHEGDWAPPFGPWIEALAVLVRDGDPARLGRDLAALGPAAAPLTRLLPSGTLPDLPAAVALSPEEERFRLHEAAGDLLLAAASSRPLLLVLDDLHWADRPSLGLLRHLVRALGTAPILVVAAYRDAELDPDHPLTDVLGAARREPGFLSLPLKGLTLPEVTDLLALAARREVSPALARAVHGETGGNPFYVGEVMRHLLDEGGLVEHAGRWTVDRGIRELGVPVGVRQVVGRRLARLADPTRRLLDHAAVFTAGVDLLVLQEMTGLPEATLLDCLDEALAAGLIRSVDDRPDAYDFAHAIVRHALDDARNPSRTVRLHRQAAHALEHVFAGREALHATELAIQYRASLALPGAARGVPHALAAAGHARDAHAREQTVVFLRIARDLAADLDPARQADILRELAVAEAEALLLEDARQTTHRALAALRAARTRSPVIAAFLATVAASLKESGAEGATWRPLVEEGLALTGDDRGLTWARLMLLRDAVAPLPGDALRAGRWLGFDPEAVAVARRDGDEEDHARTLESFDPRTPAETRALVARARGWSRPTAVLRALTVAANDVQYRHGAFLDAADLWRELAVTAERHGAVSWQAQALNQLTFLHVALGEFDLARRTQARAAELAARLGPAGGHAGEPEALAFERAFSFALYLDGDWPVIATFWTRFVGRPPGGAANEITTLAGPLYAAMAALAHARAGTAVETRRRLAALTPVLESLDPRASNQGLNGAVALAADALWTVGAPDLAAAYRHLARGIIAAGVGDYPQTSNRLTIARMAALLGDADEARAEFAAARADLDAAGQRPLRAITDHDEALAEIRAARPDADRADALLGSALSAFKALGMDGWIGRAHAADLLAARRADTRSTYPAGLTEREADVLRWIARGLSDRQIADALFISPRTVSAHVRNMLGKTNATNRAELAVWAAGHGLLAPVTDR